MTTLQFYIFYATSKNIDSTRTNIPPQDKRMNFFEKIFIHAGMMRLLMGYVYTSFCGRELLEMVGRTRVFDGWSTFYKTKQALLSTRATVRMDQQLQ